MFMTVPYVRLGPRTPLPRSLQAGAAFAGACDEVRLACIASWGYGCEVWGQNLEAPKPFFPKALNPQSVKPSTLNP